jgi:hypothetical protein
MRSVLPIRGAALDIRAVAVDVTHPGCVATCEATGYRQQGGGGSNKRWLSGRVALSSHFGLQKAPWSPETRSIWARSAKTNVCLKRPKLARQQYNRKRCDVVKNYLASFATPSRCRTSVCLGPLSRLPSCPWPGQAGGRRVLEMAAGELRVLVPFKPLSPILLAGYHSKAMCVKKNSVLSSWHSSPSFRSGPRVPLAPRTRPRNIPGWLSNTSMSGAQISPFRN